MWKCLRIQSPDNTTQETLPPRFEIAPFAPRDTIKQLNLTGYVKHCVPSELALSKWICYTMASVFPGRRLRSTKVSASGVVMCGLGEKVWDISDLIESLKIFVGKH